jgi:hypothetical protein
MRQIRINFLVLCLPLLAWGLIAAIPAAAQQNGRVNVLIGFDRTPGPNERALVRTTGGSIRFSYHLLPSIAANVPEAALAGLLRNPRVTMIEPDGKIFAIDAELDSSWGVKRIGAGNVHPTNKGAGVKVAIIDSGIYYLNDDLSANYAGGWDFVNNDADPLDDNGHGTHVAGSVGAVDNGFGVVGAAPEANLYALKILGSGGSGSWSSAIAALEWAVDNGIDVTNNSYSSSSPPGPQVQQAFDNAYQAGVLNVAAAGNTGNCAATGDTLGWPAKFASVVAVTATNSSDVRPCFSSHGPNAELAAPGVSIYSSYFDGYASLSGTSMASPHVAGTAALIIAAGETGPENVRQVLNGTALDLGPSGRDTLYGYGLVDAAAAVAAVHGPLPGDIPPWVNFTNPLDSDTVSSTVIVSADAGDDNGVMQVEFRVDGSPIGVDTNGADGWSADWDTTLEADGPHNLMTEATDAIDQTAVDSVNIEVSNLLPVMGIHVSDLDGSTINLKKNWKPKAIVTVHDTDHLPVTNAAVQGSWSTDGGATVLCVTGRSGQCTVTGGVSIRKKVHSSTFTVGDVSHASLTYVFDDNHDPEGDSNGRWIVVER